MDGPDDEDPPPGWLKNDQPAAPEEGLFVSDVELYRRLGVGPRTGRIAVRSLQHNGFPPKDPLFGNKRYWPAVRVSRRSLYSWPINSKCGAVSSSNLGSGSV